MKQWLIVWKARPLQFVYSLLLSLTDPNEAVDITAYKVDEGVDELMCWWMKEWKLTSCARWVDLTQLDPNDSKSSRDLSQVIWAPTTYDGDMWIRQWMQIQDGNQILKGTCQMEQVDSTRASTTPPAYKSVWQTAYSKYRELECHNRKWQASWVILGDAVVSLHIVMKTRANCTVDMSQKNMLYDIVSARAWHKNGWRKSLEPKEDDSNARSQALQCNCLMTSSSTRVWGRAVGDLGLKLSGLDQTEI